MWYTEYQRKNQLGTNGGRKASAKDPVPFSFTPAHTFGGRFAQFRVDDDRDRSRAHASTLRGVMFASGVRWST
jgi:hypothetical protein